MSHSFTKGVSSSSAGSIPTFWERQRGATSVTWSDNSIPTVVVGKGTTKQWELFQNPEPVVVYRGRYRPADLPINSYHLVENMRPEEKILAYENHHPITQLDMFGDLLGQQKQNVWFTPK